MSVSGNMKKYRCGHAVKTRNVMNRFNLIFCTLSTSSSALFCNSLQFVSAVSNSLEALCKAGVFLIITL